MSTHSSAFNLPDHLAAKADPDLIARDEQHFTAIAASLEQSIADLTERLHATRKAPGGTGQAALDRDQEIHRLTARVRTLRRFGLDLCLGNIVHTDDPEPVYIGRLGLTDDDGRRLLLDWRSPAAEPFFGATHANPMGLASRRRYRWTRGRITDYWDEVFTPDALRGHAALDDQSAFIASLGTDRSDKMRDVLGTIQADQDAIIRAPSTGALIVDGGPGTGKTVVALHRTAYLLYADPRLAHHHGGILYIGPHQPYLAYVADVLPSLGEASVHTCTLTDLTPEGTTATAEPDPETARRRRRHQAETDTVRARMADVVDDLLAAEYDNEGAMIMLHGQDLQDTLVEQNALADTDPDVLAGPFAHIVVDEAQELTDAEWQMLLARCPSRSFTIVGDRAQARRGFTESWRERLERIGLDQVELATLNINYRTPREVMVEAEQVIKAALPDANVPTSVRGTGLPVVHGSVGDLDAVLDAWRAEHTEGTACVISTEGTAARGRPRVRSLSPALVKGLEFDLVVLIDPESFGEGIEGAVDRYVAMTRATRQLVVLTSRRPPRDFGDGVSSRPA